MNKCLFLLCFLVINAYAQTQTCFTPGQDCRGLIVSEINKAKDTIDVQAYHITDPAIIGALLRADSKGVKIRIILDKTAKNELNSYLNEDLSIEAYVDHKVRIAHNKVMIIDRKELITGSYNFTKSAQDKNAENVLITNDVSALNAYENNFVKRMMVSISK